jgi:hypothetical protein
MTEAEILAQVGMNTELSFFLWQWWLSISIGLLAIARLLDKKLNLFLVIMLVTAYALYTLYVIDNYGVLVSQFRNLAEDLNALGDSGDIGSAARYFLQKNANPGIGVTFGLSVGAALLFFGTIGFLIYSFIENRRGR